MTKAMSLARRVLTLATMVIATGIAVSALLTVATPKSQLKYAAIASERIKAQQLSKRINNDTNGRTDACESTDTN